MSTIDKLKAALAALEKIGRHPLSTRQDKDEAKVALAQTRAALKDLEEALGTVPASPPSG